MPLIPSKSKKAISQNIRTEMHAGKPQKQAIAIAYNVKQHSEGGPIMSDSMMNSLMAKRRKKLAEGGRTEAREDANTSPDLRLQSSQLSNGSRFDDILSDEQDRSDDIDRNEALYADGGVAYNANLKENEGEDPEESHDEHTTAYDDGGVVDPNQAQSAQQSMRNAFNYPKKARGGVVSPEEDVNNIPAKSDGEEDPMNPLKKSGKAYQPKQIGNQGRPTIDLNDHRYSNGGMADIAYGQGRQEHEEGEQTRLTDEDSSIALAEGGNVGKNRVAYNKQLPYTPQLDTMEDHDEASSIALADGGEAGNEIGDERESIDSGHNDNDERHLKSDVEDTPESKDEASDIALSEGGNLIDLDGEEEADSDDVSAEQHLSPDLEDTYEESHDEHTTKLAHGGQIEDDQRKGMNPKSMQNEDEQDASMKRRRKLMIQALND